MKKVYLPTNKKNIEDLIDQIKITLINKARIDRKIHDEKNKTELGRVQFWFHTDKQGQSYLIFDKNPEIWNIDDIKVDLFNLQNYYYNKFSEPLF